MKLNGKQVALPVTDPNDLQGALRALEVLLAKHKDGGTAGPVPLEDLDKLQAEWLRLKSPDVNEHTRKSYASYLGTLCDYLAARALKRQANAFDKADLMTLAAAQPWSDSTRANFLSVARAFLVWTGRKEFATVKVPPKDSRGAEAVIDKKTQAVILNETHGDFRQLCRFLWFQGCRPMEAATLTAEMIHWDTSTATLRKHKTKDKTRAGRVLYFGPGALEVLRAQADRYTTGPLFRNKKGQQFSRMAIVQRFWRLSDKLPERVTAYHYRHTFATRALAAGMPDTHVAALLGHKNTRMIHEHYSHVANDGRLLIDELGKFEALDN